MGEYGLTAQYVHNMQRGPEYQDFVVRELYYKAGISVVSFSSQKYQCECGENISGIEIKYDDRMKQTGNVYFEIAEKRRAENKDYVASGIFRDDNTWLYAIGDHETLFLCGKTHLRQVYERECDKSPSFARFVQTPTSRGMLLPKKYVEEKLALKVIRPGVSTMSFSFRDLDEVEAKLREQEEDDAHDGESHKTTSTIDSVEEGEKPCREHDARRA
jgi:hypothetical protein